MKFTAHLTIPIGDRGSVSFTPRHRGSEIYFRNISARRCVRVGAYSSLTYDSCILGVGALEDSFVEQECTPFGYSMATLGESLRQARSWAHRVARSMNASEIAKMEELRRKHLAWHRPHV